MYSRYKPIFSNSQKKTIKMGTLIKMLTPKMFAYSQKGVDDELLKAFNLMIESFNEPWIFSKYPNLEEKLNKGTSGV